LFRTQKFYSNLNTAVTNATVRPNPLILYMNILEISICGGKHRLTIGKVIGADEALVHATEIVNAVNYKKGV
jgi:hypothetical protein